MTIIKSILAATAALALVAGMSQMAVAAGSHSDSHDEPQAKVQPTHEDEHDGKKKLLESMRESHGEHEHGHDFEAMEKLSPAELTRVVALLQDVGLVVPNMDAREGRKLFVETGCVVCHVVNGVGGEVGPSLDAANMPSPMNAFEFAARMWRGAASMSSMQEDLLGEVISLDGQQLANLVAFAHDEKEQKKLSEGQIPEKFKALISE